MAHIKAEIGNGDPDANSYVSASFADIYLDGSGRKSVAPWSDLGAHDKEQLLVEAYRKSVV